MNKIYSILFLSIFFLNPVSAQSEPEYLRDAQSISEVESIDCDKQVGYPAGNARCERYKAEKIEKLELQNKNALLREAITRSPSQAKPYFFPDDSYVGLKCTRNRNTLNPTLDFNFKRSMENGQWSFLNKDNEYSKVTYFVLSPSNKKGWVITEYIHAKMKSTDLWEFGAERYRANGPYEVTNFVISDYAYVVNFRKLNYIQFGVTQLSFNRENLAWGIPSYTSRAGTCKILDADEFFQDIGDRELEAEDYKAHNQKVIDAKKAKRKF